MRPTKVTTALGLVVSLLLVPAASAGAAPPEAPPAEKIVVEIVTVTGTGCPRGTTTVDVSPDNTAFSVLFSDYIASVGGGSKPTDFRKNCQVFAQVHAPSGFTYAISEVTYTGFAHLEKGASARVRGGYYVAGMPTVSMPTHLLEGPFDDFWMVTDVDDPSLLVWMPCGEPRHLNLNTELRVVAGTSDTATTSSYITRDALENGGSATYKLMWKRCPQE